MAVHVNQVSVVPKVSMVEALRGAHGRRIADNNFHDRLLQSGEWQQKEYNGLYPAWTGTGITFRAPGKEFGAQVMSEGITFNVPSKYQGMRDSALVLQHPDISIDESLTFGGKVLQVIPKFPRKDGWYLTYEKTGIPQGDEVSSNNPAARYFVRTGSDFVGLLARGCYGVGYGRYVYAVVGPRGGLGVAYIGNATAGGQAKAPVPYTQEELQAALGSLDRLRSPATQKDLKPLEAILRKL